MQSTSPHWDSAWSAVLHKLQTEVFAHGMEVKTGYFDFDSQGQTFSCEFEIRSIATGHAAMIEIARRMGRGVESPGQGRYYRITRDRDWVMDGSVAF